MLKNNEKEELKRKYKFYNVNNAPYVSGTVFTGKTKTQQHFEESHNINKIVAKIMKTGTIPADLRIRMGQYLDFTNWPDYQTIYNVMRQAAVNFMELPAKIRTKFDNKPEVMMDWLGKPENRKEAEDLGLILKRPLNQDPGFKEELRALSEQIKAANDSMKKAEKKAPEEPKVPVAT